MNFYACAITLIDTPPDNIYEWNADLMNPSWSSRKALNKLDVISDTMICNALLDHPGSRTSHLPAAK